MKIAIASREPDVHQVIRQLLSPWVVTFTCLDEADVSIVYGEKPSEDSESVVIPSDSEDFRKWLKDADVGVERESGIEVSVAATELTDLAITPQTYYCYDGSFESVRSVDRSSLIRLNDDVLLAIDVIGEYHGIIEEVLDPKVSILYRFLTDLPIPYILAPRRLRSFVMRKRTKRTDLNFNDKLPLDALRFFLVKAIEEITHQRLVRKMWNGKRYVCALTHDVDTCVGLRRAGILKRLELKYDVPSAWYIPAKHYELQAEKVQELSNHGEVGAHDTKHDGKLIQLSREGIVRRLSEAKRVLESIVGHDVRGFRAPLLQHSGVIFGGLLEAGYVYDSSVPSWEPRHPFCMGPCGIGTVYPLDVGGISEVPVSVPQDHQMIQVLGLNAKQTVEKWLEMKEIIKELEGICTFLVHPDYELASAEGLGVYEELLNTISADCQTLIATPFQMVK